MHRLRQPRLGLGRLTFSSFSSSFSTSASASSSSAVAAVRAGQSQLPPASVPPSVFPNSFSPDIRPHQLASYSRPPPAALAALAHRLRIADKVPLDKLEQACTHPSIKVLVHQFPDVKHTAVNGNLESLGNALLGLFASEHVHASYPHLPLRALKAAVSAYVGSLTCANIAKEIGATHLARWHRSVRFFYSSSQSILTYPTSPRDIL